MRGSALLDEILELLALAPRLAGSPREHILLSRLAQRVAIPEQEIRRQLTDGRKRQSRRLNPQPATAKATVVAPRIAVSSQASFMQRTEHELLEIIFAAPEMADYIRTRVNADEITGAALRRLLEICYDLAEQGTVPSFENVTLALEDPELKRLAVQIDESARTKEIARILHAEGCGPGGAHAGDVLTQLIDTIQLASTRTIARTDEGGNGPVGGNFRRLRRQKASRAAAAGRVAGIPSSTGRSKNTDLYARGEPECTKLITPSSN